MHILKKLLFYLLLTFRIPVLWASKILALFSLIGCGILLIIDNPFPFYFKLLAVIFCTTLWLIYWLYDELISFFIPDGYDIFLVR